MGFRYFVVLKEPNDKVEMYHACWLNGLSKKCVANKFVKLFPLYSIIKIYNKREYEKRLLQMT